MGKKQNNAICSNMNGHGVYHIKWSRSDNANAIWYHLMGNLKKKNGTNELTYKTVTDSEDKLMATKEER